MNDLLVIASNVFLIIFNFSSVIGYGKSNYGKPKYGKPNYTC